jgi:serine protease Do
MRKLLLLLALSPIFLAAQSISPERVAKLKSATVRISVENVPATGTAFFISASGELLTCWHVIEPAFIRDTTGLIVYTRKIFIEFANGDKTEVTVPPVFSAGSLYISGRSNDYCLLTPVKALARPFSFYKLGDFTTVTEGQEIYSCGYPNGMLQPFVSRGIFSTRYIDSAGYLNVNGQEKKVYRDAALLDLAMNKGCSGAPIIKPGASPADDEVIGIANFILNPYGQGIQEVNNILSKAEADASMAPLLNIMKYLSSVNENASVSISSCLSINHFLKDLQSLKK